MSKDSEILVFVSQNCPHCRALLQSAMFKRLTLWYPVHIVDVTTDWGVNLAAQYLQLSVEEKTSPTVHRVVKTPMVVVRGKGLAKVTYPPHDPEAFYMNINSLLARVGLPAFRLPLTEGERRERKKKR
ncbi:MAG: hypothetical protein QW498_08540 [Thermofilum sp.]